MIRRWFRSHPGEPMRSWPSGILVFATGLSLATAALVWLTWMATSEMRRSTRLLLERRASEVMALTFAALTRDMRGAWLSVLAPIDALALKEDPPYDILLLTGRAFARFPYPESFIVWSADDVHSEGRTYAFNRTDRAIPWQPPESGPEAYPVALLDAPAALQPMVSLILETSRHRRRFTLIETTIDGVPYQVVSHLFFVSPDQTKLTAFIAFTVNLTWVREHYLSELLRQVATIDGDEDAMAITVLDEDQQVVATSGARSLEEPVRRRTFPLLFFEPALVTSLPTGHPPIRTWTAQVQPATGASGAASALGTQMLLLTSMTGAAALVAVLLTVRAVRSSAQLATMKSDFVAAVTHELKTPVSLIKLVGETLERGRYSSPETIQDYASILSQEARRLNHLIENLLTYSRLSDLHNVYAFEPLDVAELVDDALDPFRPRLEDLGFVLTVDVAPDLPQVRADRSGIVQVFANIVDNAVKYSPDDRRLTIVARPESGTVAVSFADHGSGIPAEEVARVFDKFYRGRGTSAFGSGLGLSIVRRVVHEHGGTARLTSQFGAGTTVTIALPMARRI